MEDLPEDVIIVLIETLCRMSRVSVIVLAHVSKFCYKLAHRCAKENRINRTLQCREIAAEGSLEVLKWARSNGCRGTSKAGFPNLPLRGQGEWNSYTCAWAAENGHLEVLE